ncbi:MAG: PD-(D/E)XK nuclease family protein [Planctomycetota bacterium]|nr:PD-(D/E)XK nuclease family protein [Planctomycetota bacterium]
MQSTAAAGWCRQMRGESTDQDEQSATVVVVPSARARLEFLAALCVEDGILVHPPEVILIESFLDQALELGIQENRSATAIELLKGAIDALRLLDQESALALGVIGRSPLVLVRSAIALQQVLDALASAAILPEHVAQTTSVRANELDSQRWMALGQWRAMIEESLARVGAQGPMHRRLFAIESGSPRWNRVVLSGIDDATPMLARTVEALRSRGVHVDILVHAPQEYSASFDSSGVPKPGAFSAEAAVPLEQIIAASEPDDQAEAILAQWARHAQSAVAIVVADESIVPAIRRTFSSRGVQVNGAKGTPAWRTHAGRLLTRLAACSMERTTDALHALVADQAVSAASCDQQQELLSTLLKCREDELRQSVDEQLDALSKVHVPGVSWLLDCLNLDRCAAGVTTGRDLFSKLNEIIGTLVVPLCSLDAVSSDIEHRGLTAVSKILEECAIAFADEKIDRDSIPALMGVARDMVAKKVIHTKQDENALEVYGWLEAPHLPAQTMVIGGVHGDSLPSVVARDGWLTESVRDAIGLPTAAKRMARDAFRLAGLRHRFGDKLMVVAARSSGEGDSLPLPRILLGAVGELTRDGAQQLARRVQHFDSKSDQRPSLRVRVESSGDGNGFDAAPSLPKTVELSRISVTAFKEYLESPYTYWLKQIEKLRQPEIDEREFHGVTLGAFLHLAWKSVSIGELARERNRDQLESSMRDSFEAAATRQLHRLPSPLHRLQLDRMRERIPLLAELEATERAKGWYPLLAEHKMEDNEALVLDVTETPIMLEARIDRVDQHESTGEIRVLDLKSGQDGESPSESHFKPDKKHGGNQWFDLQLPLYRLLVSRMKESRDATSLPQVGYLISPPARNCPTIVMADAADQWTEAHFVEAIERAREIVRAIRRGELGDASEISKKDQLFARIARASQIASDGGVEDALDE